LLLHLILELACSLHAMLFWYQSKTIPIICQGITGRRPYLLKRMKKKLASMVYILLKQSTTR